MKECYADTEAWAKEYKLDFESKDSWATITVAYAQLSKQHLPEFPDARGFVRYRFTGCYLQCTKEVIDSGSLVRKN